MRLDKRLELRTSNDDLSRWQLTARAKGYRAVADWIRTALNREASLQSEDQSGPPGPAYRKTTFENGVRIVTESIPGAESVAVGVFIDCGWRDEIPHQAGLAQLCQRMIFRGTSSRDASQIAREMEYTGGRIGGFTRRDYTCISALVPGDRRLHTLDLLGDLLLNSTFPPEQLEREKLWIAQQAAGNLDQPAFHCAEKMKSEAWGGNSISRLSGPAPLILDLTREDAIYFLETHYSPNRIIIAASGDLEHEDFTAQTRDSFWRLIGESDAQPFVKPGFCEGQSITALPAGQAYFSLGFEAPDYAHSGRPAIELLTSVLGGGASSRLSRAIDATPGLVCEVSAAYEASREAGILVVSGQTQPASLVHAVNTVMEVVLSLGDWQQPVTEEELLLAKSRLRCLNRLDAQSPHARMTRLGTQELYFGRHVSLEQSLSELEAVDINALRRLVSSEWRLALRRPRLAVIGPELEASSETRLRHALRGGQDRESRVPEYAARIA